MTTDGWPYPSLADRTWLRPPGPQDPALAAARDAVRTLVPVTGPSPSCDELLDAVTAVRDLAERLDWALLSLLGEARAAGATWDDIGAHLGVTRQAAHKRFAPYIAEALARAAAPSECA